MWLYHFRGKVWATVDPDQTGQSDLGLHCLQVVVFSGQF